ncbi:MAG: di-heme oxidoredictase family protein, partial [Dongiaceae bacterium]
PIEGLNPAEFELFNMGLDDFLEVEDGEEGLGPIFNGRSCAECHSVPSIGGSGTIMEIRAGRRNEDGSFTEFPPGSVFQMFSLPPHGCQKLVPSDANVFSRRKSLPIFGDGLIEAIPDETLLARAAANEAHPDQIGGRAHIVLDVFTNRLRVGRFGWKAQQATLMTFGAEAYRDEMGITNDLFGSEAIVYADERQERDCDPRPDPEDVRDRTTRLRGIDNFANFMRMLGPPPRGERTSLSAAGELIFEQIGCAACHVPEMTTGQAVQAVLSRKPVPLFSDLLLHDIGAGDGLPQDDASGDEFRTTPLWGLRVRAPLMHDGRAATILDAIRMHERQAGASRRRFEALSDVDRAALLEFLRTL